MSFDHKTKNDPICIATVGGEFALIATNRTADDLIRIAAAAIGEIYRIAFKGPKHRTINGLIRNGTASKGCVTLEG